jgi:hypothetical protein
MFRKSDGRLLLPLSRFKPLILKLNQKVQAFVFFWHKKARPKYDLALIQNIGLNKSIDLVDTF